jgi:hypothetical protein
LKFITKEIDLYYDDPGKKLLENAILFSFLLKNTDAHFRDFGAVDSKAGS